MTDHQRKIPTFNDVMKKPTQARGVPTFEDIMGDEPPKKKDISEPSLEPPPTSLKIGQFGAKALGSDGQSTETKPTTKFEIEDVPSFNRQFEEKTGHREFDLGSDLPQISKAKEEKRFQRYNQIQENEIDPVLQGVNSGTIQPQKLAALYNKPYGKKIVSEIIAREAPEFAYSALDQDVVGNEQKWDEIAKDIQLKNRDTGIEKQDEFMLQVYDNLSNAKNALLGKDIGSAERSRGGGGVDETPIGEIDVTSAKELGDFIQRLRAADYVKGADKLGLIKNTQLALIMAKAKEETPTEITAMSGDIQQAIRNLKTVGWKTKGGENIEQGEAKDAKYVIEGLNYLKDVNPAQYKNIIRGIGLAKTIADTDYEELVGIGKEIQQQKDFSGGEIVADDNRDFSTFQTRQAELSGILSEKIKDLGYKNMAKVPDKAIVSAAMQLGIDPESPELYSIRKNEANGGYGVSKGGILNAIARGAASPVKAIQQSFESLSDPVSTYLNSRRYDYGDQKIPDDKGNYSDVLPSERKLDKWGNIFNKMGEGFAQFGTQVLFARGLGSGLAAPYNMAAKFVPRAAMTSAQATNLAAYGGGFLSTAAQTYGSSYIDFLNKTGNPDKAALMATVDALGQSALEVGVMPDVKIAESMKGALAGARDRLATGIVGVVERGGKKEAIEPFITTYAKEVGKVLGKEVGIEENLQNWHNYFTEALFSPQTAKDRNPSAETNEVIKEAGVQMLIPALLGGLGGARNNPATRKMTKDALHSGAINFDQYKTLLDLSLAEGNTSQDNYNKAILYLSTHRQSLVNAPKLDAEGNPVSMENQLEYAFQETMRKVNQTKADNETDDVLKKHYEQKAKEANEIKKEIFEPKEVPISREKSEVGIETNELIQKAIDENVLKGMDIEVAKAAIAKEGGGEELLVSIADQALDKKPVEGISAEENMKRARETYGDELVDLAIQKYPVKEGGKETATIESAVIEIGGKTYEGKNHAEAILNAQKAGEDISQVDRQRDGKFKLSDGTVIDRAETKTRFGQDRSELLIEQDDAADQANKDYKKLQNEQTTEQLPNPLPSTEKSGSTGGSEENATNANNAGAVQETGGGTQTGSEGLSQEKVGQPASTIPEQGGEKVGGIPKAVDEKSIAESQQWLGNLFSLPDYSRIKDKDGNVYEVANNKLSKLILNDNGKVIDKERLYNNRRNEDGSYRSSQSTPDFFRDGYEILKPESNVKEATIGSDVFKLSSEKIKGTDYSESESSMAALQEGIAYPYKTIEEKYDTILNGVANNVLEGKMALDDAVDLANKHWQPNIKGKENLLSVSGIELPSEIIKSDIERVIKENSIEQPIAVKEQTNTGKENNDEKQIRVKDELVKRGISEKAADGVSKQLVKALDDKGAAHKLLHPDNKNSRELWSKETGMSLPKTVGGTKDAIDAYFIIKDGGLKPFEEIVNNSNSAKEAFDEVKKLTNVSKEVAKAFSAKYDPKKSLTPEQAFEKFYNEVKEKTNVKEQTNLLINENKKPDTKSNESKPSEEGSNTKSQPDKDSGETEKGTGEPPKETETGLIGDAEGELVGITHAETDKIAEQLGFPVYETKPETVAEWDAEADKRIAEGYNIDELFKRMEDGVFPDKIEQRIIAKYVADLKAKINKDPTNENLAKMKRAKELSDIVGGREVAKSLVARKGLRPVEESKADWLVQEMEDAAVDELTDQQKKTVADEWDKISKAQKEFDDYVAAKEVEIAEKEAKITVQEERKKTKPNKKTKQDFSAERKDIVNDIREKLKKARQDTSATILPYAKELFAIAPDVAKLVKSYVEQGLTELSEIAQKIYDDLKPEIPDIQKRDVNDLIRGEYNEKKATKNELTEKLRDLRTEADLIDRLEKLEVGEEPTSEKKKIRRNAKIADLRKRVKEHDLSKLADYKKRTKSQIDKIEQQLKDGDFSTKKPKVIVPLDSEGRKLQKKLIDLKRDREVRRLKEQYDKRSDRLKMMDKLAEITNIPRSIMASTDFSAPFNQAIVATTSYPRLAKAAMGEMIKSAFSQSNFDKWFYDLKESPRYDLMKEVELGIADPHSPFLTAREEAFMSGYAEQIPVAGKIIKGSERAYVQFLNKMRVDLFNKFVDRFEEKGKTYANSKRLYEKTAKYINNITGRGNLGKLEQYAPVFNGLLFSPRLMASRIALLNPYYFATLPKELKIAYAKDMGTFIGVGMTVLGLFSLYASTAGADDDDEDKITVENDPRSSDFAKIRQGDTRWNIWGGFQPYVKLAAQLGYGQRKSTNSGVIYELDGEGAFGQSRGDVIASFFRGKLAPVPSMSIDLVSGRDAVGKEVTVRSELLDAVTPLSIGAIIDAWKQYGALSLLKVGVPSMFGVGTQTFLKPEREVTDKIPYDGRQVKMNKEQHKEYQNLVNENTDVDIKKLHQLPQYKDLTDPKARVDLENVVKGAALRKAQKEIIKRYPDTFTEATKEEKTEKKEKEKSRKELLKDLE